MFHPMNYSKQELMLRLKLLSDHRIDFDENGKVINEFAAKKLTPEQSELLIEICYAIAINNPTLLKKYNKWKPSEVYGEIRLHQLENILKMIDIKKNDIFLDIGSGIGQTAIYSSLRKMFKKAYGIEIATMPVLLATLLEEVLDRVLKVLGKTTGRYKLIQGDCLDRRNLHIIREANVIFMNDLTFTPQLRERIITRLLRNLKDGSVIINTSGALGLKEGREINRRSIENRRAYISSKKVLGEPDGVSWTPKPIVFWINTLNREKVRAFKLQSKA